MSKNIHFDENFQIRALDPEMHAHSAKTEAEAKEFMDLVTQFTDLVGSLSGDLQGQARRIEAEKLTAIGRRNRVDTEQDAVQRQQQQLGAQLRERRAQLERLGAQAASLERQEAEQRRWIDKLSMQE